MLGVTWSSAGRLSKDATSDRLMMAINDLWISRGQILDRTTSSLKINEACGHTAPVFYLKWPVKPNLT